MNLKNIKIIFDEKDVNLNNIIEYITKFKKNNEDYIITNNINFKINYSNEYKKINMFKQINLNVIRFSLLFIILSVGTMMLINLYVNYSDTEKYDDIENDLNKIKLELDIPANNNEEIIYIEPNDFDMKDI